MRKLAVILLFFSAVIYCQTINGDGQVVIMVNNDDSIYLEDSLKIYTLITNHDDINTIPIIEAYTEDEILDAYALYKNNLDSLPNYLEWCEINVYYRYDTTVIKCLQSHNRTIHPPEEIPALFLFRNPITCDDWIQPTGGHDAYNTGDCVIFEGDQYESLIDANVWSPTVYPAGWQIQ